MLMAMLQTQARLLPLLRHLLVPLKPLLRRQLARRLVKLLRLRETMPVLSLPRLLLLRYLRVPLRLLRRQQLVQLRPRSSLLKVVVLMPSVQLQPRRCSQTADPSRMLRKPLVLLQLQQPLLLVAML